MEILSFTLGAFFVLPAIFLGFIISLMLPAAFIEVMARFWYISLLVIIGMVAPVIYMQDWGIDFVLVIVGILALNYFFRIDAVKKFIDQK